MKPNDLIERIFWKRIDGSMPLHLVVSRDAGATYMLWSSVSSI